MRLAKRNGLRKATVAVARKLAVILHRKGPILWHLPDPRYYFNVHTRSCAA